MAYANESSRETGLGAVAFQRLIGKINVARVARGVAPVPTKSKKKSPFDILKSRIKAPAVPSRAGPVIPAISIDPGASAPPLPPQIPAPIAEPPATVSDHGWFGGGGSGSAMTQPDYAFDDSATDGSEETSDVVEAGVTSGGGLGNVPPLVFVVGLGALFLLAGKKRR
jgi:hypothetical protein